MHSIPFLTDKCYSVPMSNTEPRYVGSQAIYEVLGLRVVVHLAEWDGIVRCIGLDVHGFEWSQSEQEAVREALSTVDGLDEALAEEVERVICRAIAKPGEPRPIRGQSEVVEVTPEEYRRVPVRRTVTTAREDVLAIGRVFEQMRAGGRQVFAYWRQSPPWADKLPRPRPAGRPAQLTRELLAEVVAPAWRLGLPGKVTAVRRALESATGRPTNDDQAKKAIRKARDAGLIPPANRRNTNPKEKE